MMITIEEDLIDKIEREIESLYEQCREAQENLRATYHLGLPKALDIIRKHKR